MYTTGVRFLSPNYIFDSLHFYVHLQKTCQMYEKKECQVYEWEKKWAG